MVVKAEKCWWESEQSWVILWDIVTEAGNSPAHNNMRGSRVKGPYCLEGSLYPLGRYSPDFDDLLSRDGRNGKESLFASQENDFFNCQYDYCELKIGEHLD